MSQHTANKYKLVITMGACIAVTIVMLTGHLIAQAPLGQGPVSAAKPNDPNMSKFAFKVGTYNPQAVFAQHPLKKVLLEKYTSLQTAMQEARQKGDQQKEMQLQQQFEQERKQITEKFESDLKKAFPEVAEETDTKVIALEIAYTEKDVGTLDVTPHLIKTFAAKDQKRRTKPQFQFPDR